MYMYHFVYLYVNEYQNIDLYIIFLCKVFGMYKFIYIFAPSNNKRQHNKNGRKTLVAAYT